MLIYTLFLILLIIVSLLLAGVILIQSGDGGISSAIGGSSQASNTFGASTPAVMVKITTTLAVVFAVITLGLNIYSLNANTNETKSSLISHAERGITPLNFDLPVEGDAEAPVETAPVETAPVEATPVEAPVTSPAE